MEKMRTAPAISGRFVARQGGEDTERIGGAETLVAVIVKGIVKVVARGGGGGGRGRGVGVVVFGIVSAQENDVVLAELVGAGGGGVVEQGGVRGDAEEALGGGESIHAGSGPSFLVFFF